MQLYTTITVFSTRSRICIICIIILFTTAKRTKPSNDITLQISISQYTIAKGRSLRLNTNNDERIIFKNHTKMKQVFNLYAIEEFENNKIVYKDIN